MPKSTERETDVRQRLSSLKQIAARLHGLKPMIVGEKAPCRKLRTLHHQQCKFQTSANPSLEKSRKWLKADHRQDTALFMLRCDRHPVMLTCYRQLGQKHHSHFTFL
jgi:hypothetical protein